ncbi:MAG: hypothetical protein ACOCUD_03835 [Bacillota bacterium]
MKRKRVRCEKCGGYYSKSNIEKHKKSCNGQVKKKLENCKYCNMSFKGMNTSERANHTRWCEKNPKLDYYKKNASNNVVNNISRKINYEEVGKKIKEAWGRGCYLNVDHGKGKRGKHLSSETKKKLSESNRKLKYRRLRRNTINYIKKDGSIVLLDSTWEKIFAEKLDVNNIEWIRPEPILYSLEDGEHNYFPDFYLPKYDLYIDPKNPHAYNVQIKKIDVLREQVSNLIFLTSLDEINNFISKLLGRL